MIGNPLLRASPSSLRNRNVVLMAHRLRKRGRAR